MRNKEDIISEARTIEAVKKGYMSAAGKIGVIARVMGDRVVARHDSRNVGHDPVYENLYGFGQNFMYNEEDELEEGQLPEMTDGERHTAHLYNGYSRGWHLEIKLDGPELWVLWQGERVFHEISGRLEMYCPGEWEPIIDKLCVEARRKENTYIELSDQRSELVGQRIKDAFLDDMKRKWGLK